jgi:SAM-dependent methyltransferase
MEDKEWFETWFDSSYYPVLYAHRDEKEADGFVSKLFARLDIEKGTRVLDLGCGSGRHSIIMHKLGMRVFGLDLSMARIEEGRISAGSNGPVFLVGDMRNFVLDEPVDVVCNLFTSFGYFGSKLENEEVLRNVWKNLTAGGKLIIDFMNTPRILRDLVKEEILERQGYTFQIRRAYSDGLLRKKISVTDGSKQLHFEECVQALFLEDFIALFASCGFHLLFTFGDYSLEPYDTNNSPRMILIAEKCE